MYEVNVYIEKCRGGAIIPSYANQNDAGMDIVAIDYTVIRPGETVIIPTGLKFAVPVGYEIQVRPRSGITVNTPLRISNSPGTIDSGYRGELGIIMTNISEESYFDGDVLYEIKERGNKKGNYVIRIGDRIAQIVLNKVPTMKFKLVDCVENIGQNRGGGFGSTGVR